MQEDGHSGPREGGGGIQEVPHSTPSTQWIFVVFMEGENQPATHRITVGKMLEKSSWVTFSFSVIFSCY